MRATLLREMKRTVWSMRLSATREATSTERKLRTPLRLFCGSVAICACVTTLHAQSPGPGHSGASANDIQAMQERIGNLETEVAELKAMIHQLQPTAGSSSAGTPSVLASSFSAPVKSTAPVDENQSQSADKQSVVQAEDKKTLEFLRGTTLDLHTTSTIRWAV